MIFYLKTVYTLVEIQSKGPLSAGKKCFKCIGVGHPRYRLQYAIVILLGVGESKILTSREKIINREGEGAKGWQQMHGEIMIQNQRAKTAVTWSIVRRVKNGFIINFMTCD